VDWRAQLIEQIRGRALLYATLCRIAGAVDRGMFEAAGFAIENRTWTPGAPGCCHLSVRRA